MNDATWETRLASQLEQLARHYQVMDQVMDRLADESVAEGEIHAHLASLARERQSIEQWPRDCQSLMESYRQRYDHASPVIRQLSESITERIRNMIVKVSQLEERTKQQVRDLIPQANTNVRGMMMRNAYRQNVNV